MNRIEWILDAIQRSAQMFQGYGLDIAIVSYKRPRDTIQEYIPTARFCSQVISMAVKLDAFFIFIYSE